MIKKEKPNAMIATMGGQTAINVAMNAETKGRLKKYKIELNEAKSKAISNAEDRKKVRKKMKYLKHLKHYKYLSLKHCPEQNQLYA